MSTQAAARLEAIGPALEEAFDDGWLRLYSLEANPLPAVVRELVPRGWLANVVSLGEWDAARRAGMHHDPAVAESPLSIRRTDARWLSAAERPTWRRRGRREPVVAGRWTMVRSDRPVAALPGGTETVAR